MCVNWPDMGCNVIGGGDGKWFDACRSSDVWMPEGEGVLMVVGVSDQYTQPPRGIRLIPFSKSNDSVGAYYLIEP